jgi:hypothetical protein
MKQFQIPTEARSKFVEMMKEDLIRDGGVVDTKATDARQFDSNGNKSGTC